MSDARAGSFEDVTADEPHPGVVRRSVDAAGATITRYEFAPGARFPLHRHPQEQITLLEAGSLRMALGDDEQELGAGGWSIVPGDVVHGIVAGAEGARFTAIVVPGRATADAYEVIDE
jgi:quercetin dioxygenase-like cupin family protein